MLKQQRSGSDHVGVHVHRQLNSDVPWAVLSVEQISFYNVLCIAGFQ